MTTATAAPQIEARFASTCPRCHQGISKGELLEKVQVGQKRQYCHVGCLAQSVPPSAYRTNAKDGVKKCPRCSKPILEGQQLVKWDDGPLVKVRGKEATQWVHVDCESVDTSVSKVTAAPTDVESTISALLESIDYSKIDDEIEKTVDGKLSTFKEQMADSVASAAQKILERSERVAEMAAKSAVEAIAPRKVVFAFKTVAMETDEHTHPALPRLVQLAQQRKHIFLPGPAGCGKSHIAAQLNEMLGKVPVEEGGFEKPHDFGFISCSVGMSEGQLTGRLLPVGDNGQFIYVRSEFVRCYEEGGVFLLDEMDAADPNVLIVVNAALANGKMALPNRPENPVANKHKDFVLVAAANTFGRGADRLYCGRNELDEATLDRFRIGTVPMNYDDGSSMDVELAGNRPSVDASSVSSKGIESQLCPDVELRGLLQLYRKRAEDARLERIVSTRFMIDAYTMVKGSGWTLDDVEQQLFSGWSTDEVRKVRF